MGLIVGHDQHVSGLRSNLGGLPAQTTIVEVMDTS